MADDIVHTWFLGGGATDQKSGVKSGNGLMIEKEIISIGYSWEIENISEYKPFNKYENYFNYWDARLKDAGKKWNKSTMHILYDNVKKGDLIWTRVSSSPKKRNNGYWVARLNDNPQKLFRSVKNKSSSSFKYFQETDSLVHLKKIKWYGPFTEEEVPGSVSTHPRYKTKAIRRIDVHDAIKLDKNGKKWSDTSIISQYLLERKFDKSSRSPKDAFERLQYDKKANPSNDEKLKFFNLIGWWGLEDIIGLWLQTKGYWFQPSTCKIGSTPYEYVLINPKTGSKVFVQAKNSEDIKLTKDKYQWFLNGKNIGKNDEFYLVSLGGIDGKKDDKIKILRKDASGNKDEIVSFDELINFVFSGVNDNVLPLHIKTFRDYLYKN